MKRICNKPIATPTNFQSPPLGGGREGLLILKLRRIRICEKTCDGRLYAEDGTYICDTAEATPYMLAAGEHNITPKSKLLSKGNGVYNLRNQRILLGTYIVPGCLKHSAKAYDRLYQRIKKARQRKKQVVLVIEECSD